MSFGPVPLVISKKPFAMSLKSRIAEPIQFLTVMMHFEEDYPVNAVTIVNNVL